MKIKNTVNVKYATVADAKKTVAKVKKINKPYARKVRPYSFGTKEQVREKTEQAKIAKRAKKY